MAERRDRSAAQQLFDEVAQGREPLEQASQKKLRILESASELFVQLGYRKTSVEDVAQRAGVAKGTVYLSFKSKAEILKTAIAMEEQAYMARIKPILTQDMDDRERLKLWISNLVAMGTYMPLTFRLFGGDNEILTALDEIPEELARRSLDLTVEFTKELVEAATVPRQWDEQALHDCATVIGGLSHYWQSLEHSPLREQLSVDRSAQVLAELTVDGLLRSAGPTG